MFDRIYGHPLHKERFPVQPSFSHYDLESNERIWLDSHHIYSASLLSFGAFTEILTMFSNSKGFYNAHQGFVHFQRESSLSVDFWLRFLLTQNSIQQQASHSLSSIYGGHWPTFYLKLIHFAAIHVSVAFNLVI